MIIRTIHAEEKTLYIEFEDEVLTSKHLKIIEKKFTDALFIDKVEALHFHTHKMRIPPIFLSLAFGRFMMGIQKHMHDKRTFIDAPARVRNFLKFFFTIYKPKSTVVWV